MVEGPEDNLLEHVEKEAAEALLEKGNKEIDSARERVDTDKLKQWNNRGYSIETSDDSGSYSIIIIGERHADEEQWQKQIELTRLVKPEYVLHEWFAGWVYNPETRKFEKQKGKPQEEFDPNIEIGDHNDPNVVLSAFGLPSELYRTADEVGFKIIGCDLTRSEIREIERALGMKSSAMGTEEELMRVRDMEMTDKIIEYQSKSSKPIIVILGYDHGDNIHQQQLLKEKGEFGYVYVRQGDVGSRNKENNF